MGRTFSKRTVDFLFSNQSFFRGPPAAIKDVFHFPRTEDPFRDDRLREDVLDAPAMLIVAG